MTFKPTTPRSGMMRYMSGLVSTALLTSCIEIPLHWQAEHPPFDVPFSLEKANASIEINFEATKSKKHDFGLAFDCSHDEKMFLQLFDSLRKNGEAGKIDSTSPAVSLSIQLIPLDRDNASIAFNVPITQMQPYSHGSGAHGWGKIQVEMLSKHLERGLYQLKVTNLVPQASPCSTSFFIYRGFVH